MVDAHHQGDGLGPGWSRAHLLAHPFTTPAVSLLIMNSECHMDHAFLASPLQHCCLKEWLVILLYILNIGNDTSPAKRSRRITEFQTFCVQSLLHTKPVYLHLCIAAS